MTITIIKVLVTGPRTLIYLHRKLMAVQLSESAEQVVASGAGFGRGRANPGGPEAGMDGWLAGWLLDGWMDGWMDGWRREGGREGGMEGGMEGWREGWREGGMDAAVGSIDGFGTCEC